MRLGLRKSTRAKVIKGLLILLTLHTQYLVAEENCDLGSDGLAASSDAILAGAEASVSCEGKGASATPAQQTQLLDLIRQDSINRRLPELTRDLNDEQVNRGVQTVREMRLLLAIQKVEIDTAEGSLEDLGSGRTGLTWVLPSRIIFAPGMEVTPEPLTEGEHELARRALASEKQAAESRIRELINRRIPEIESLGMNATVPVASEVGDLQLEIQKQIQKNAATGYETMVMQQNPWLMYVTKAEPTAADIRAGHAKYREKLQAEMRWASTLRISHPPDEAALGFLFYSRSVSQVISQRPDLCPAFNALMEQLRSTQKFRDMLNLGIGLTAAGLCIGAAFFTAGLAIAGCLAAGAVEAASSVIAASDNATAARLLYAGVLQGGSREEYEARTAAAKGYILAAGLAGIGLAGGAFQVFHAASASAHGLLSTADNLAAGVADGAASVADDVAQAGVQVADDVASAVPPRYPPPAVDRANGFAPITPPRGNLNVDIAAAFPDVSPILRGRLEEAFRRFDGQAFDPKVARIEDIPWGRNAGGSLSDTQIRTMQTRLSYQPAEIRNATLAVYNRLNDKAAFETYMTKLLQDSIADIRSRGIPAELAALEQGTITRNATLRVLVRRARARGEGNISTIVSESRHPGVTATAKPDSNAGFRDAVGQGPFFDKPFGEQRHGVDMHFLQRDFVSDAVSTATNGNPKMFWDFLGSPRGINYWVPLFDASQTSAVTLASPELLHHQIIRFLPLE